MIAESITEVTCPACAGLGSRKRYVNPRKSREIPCLACRRTGRVAAERVCPACGKFIDMCLCVIGERNVAIKPLKDYKPMRIYVHWVDRANAWAVNVYRDGKTEFLAQFKDQALAEQMAKEAESVSPDQYSALRTKYREIRKEVRAAAKQSEPVSEPTSKQSPAPVAVTGKYLEVPDTSEQIAQGNLLALVQAALAADEAMITACKDAQVAEQAAVAAWNAVAEALRDAAGPESAFNRSEFGSIVLERQS